MLGTSVPNFPLWVAQRALWLLMSNDPMLTGGELTDLTDPTTGGCPEPGGRKVTSVTCDRSKKRTLRKWYDEWAAAGKEHVSQKKEKGRWPTPKQTGPLSSGLVGRQAVHKRTQCLLIQPHPAVSGPILDTRLPHGCTQRKNTSRVSSAAHLARRWRTAPQTRGGAKRPLSFHREPHTAYVLLCTYVHRR
jgi:hypothetical protein